MNRAIVAVALATAVLVALPAALGATPHPRIQVKPHVVRAGGVLRIRGRAAGCPTINSVTVISRAFVKNRTHNFAGLGAVNLRQHANHLFRGMAHIRKLARGKYRITARCGGANLGVSARVRVTA